MYGNLVGTVSQERSYDMISAVCKVEQPLISIQYARSDGNVISDVSIIIEHPDNSIKILLNGSREFYSAKLNIGAYSYNIALLYDTTLDQFIIERLQILRLVN